MTPLPAATLRVAFTVTAKGDVLYHVHQDRYQPHQFNPGVHGNARFSPIQVDLGRAILTLYGGTTVECVLMESISHDVPHTAGFKSFDKGKLTGQVYSAVQVSQPLHLMAKGVIHAAYINKLAAGFIVIEVRDGMLVETTADDQHKVIRVVKSEHKEASGRVIKCAHLSWREVERLYLNDVAA